MTDPANRPGQRADKPDDQPAPTRLDARAAGPKKGTGRDLAGTTLGDFQLSRRIGSGGMGEVYLAQQMSLKRHVALKVLRQDATPDETTLKRFNVEAEAAAKLTHANIVQIYAFSQQDGLSYMALEYVRGMNLRDYVTKKGPVSARVAVKLMDQVAAALHHASEMGVVHRDIKPDNIMLTRKGEVKVADFGLARLRSDKPVNLTQPGITMGTPMYMSPEQVEDKATDARSDLYSFGVTSYYMLAGQPPYRGETAMGVAVQHLKGNPEPLAQLRPDLPAELCRIVHKLMAKDPDLRYQTGRQVSRDLQKLRAELAASKDDAPLSTTGEVAAAAVEASPGETRRLAAPRLDSIRRNLVWWFAATVVVGSLSGSGYAWYLRTPELRPKNIPKAPPPSIDLSQLPQMKTARDQYQWALFAGEHGDAEAAWLSVINHSDYEPEWVWRAQLRLGQHYVDAGQRDKATKFFGELAELPDEKARAIGLIGQAVLLSLADQPQASLDALWRVIQDGTSGWDRSFFLWTFSTMERNYRNLGEDWDPDIRRWANSKLPLFRPMPPGGRGGDRPPPPN
jgi:serine/threonine-protein kinase